MTTPITLTIAGSDSGGGAGIQADIKAISATGGYACSVVTALTAQNTLGVSGILPIPAEFVGQQLDAVFSDLAVKAVKIGMLADADIIKIIAHKLQQYRPQFVVLDPVMVATSGDLLLPTAAVDCLKQDLLSLANLITPNLPEAAQLIGHEFDPQYSDMKQFAEQCQLWLQQLGGDQRPAVLLKGGHLSSDSMSRDYLIDASQLIEFSAPRVDTPHSHGTGCTLSAAIASMLAQGYPLQQAVARAKRYLTLALTHADELKIGAGHGPVHHFYAWPILPVSQDECSGASINC